MLRHLGACAITLFFGLTARQQPPAALTVPVDSPRWEPAGQAKTADYLGRTFASTCPARPMRCSTPLCCGRD